MNKERENKQVPIPTKEETKNILIDILSGIDTYYEIKGHKLVLNYLICMFSDGNGDCMDYATFAKELKKIWMGE